MKLVTPSNNAWKIKNVVKRMTQKFNSRFSDALACTFPFHREAFAGSFCGMAKPVLGRGLSALFGGAGSSARPAENLSQAPSPAAADDGSERVRLTPVARV